MLQTLTTRTVLRGAVALSPPSQFPRALSVRLQPTSNPIHWRSIAPFSAIATIGPSKPPRIPRKIYTWTPDIDAKIIQLRNDNVPWKKVEKAVDVPYIRCKERYRHLVEVKRPESWSMDIEKSTMNEKSLPELKRLLEEGKSWSEIAGIMSTEVVVCQRQWSGLGKRYYPGAAGTFQGATFNIALESGSYKLNRPRGAAVETVESSTKKSPSKSLLGVELYDWEKMSLEMFNSKFSPEYIRYRFVLKARNELTWTEEDLLALSEYFKKSTPHLSSLSILAEAEPNWHSVSRNVVQGRHSPFECRLQWQRTKKKNRQIKEYPPWTAAEILEYWHVWNKEGKNWPVIANYIQSGHQPRTPENCRQNFSFVVQKAEELRAAGNIDMDASYEIPREKAALFPWTAQQDADLQRIVQEEIKYNNDNPRKAKPHSSEPPRPRPIPWKRISERLHIGANNHHCRNRWMRLTNDPSWYETPLDRPHFWDGDLDRLVELVAKDRPNDDPTWKQFQAAHFPMHGIRLLRHTWSRASVNAMKQSKKLANQLELLVLRYGEHMWSQVAKEMTENGHHCIHRHCHAAWSAQYDHMDTRWSSDELDQLVKAVEEVQNMKSNGKKVKKTTADGDAPGKSTLPDVNIKDWVKIGKLFPSKTSFLCQSKWAEIKLREIEDAEGVTRSKADPQPSPSSAQGKPAVRPTVSWTPQNIALLRGTIRKYGASPYVFEHLAKRLGSTPSNCLVRWAQFGPGDSSSN
ncbi:hypothetical protein EDD21DRAFT_407765 [Dissophora ornata]|nr:hypothetical protein BGZ58_001228 [Dissophora ornata]KAI8597224.1 hypothetical protein EDD21DRAFT_407765 [Dissophora ornata]